MVNNNRLTEPGKQYKTAHDAHYKAKDIPQAFQIYRNIITDHPNTKEAGYSLSQVHNIVNSVVPKQEIMDALVAMTLDHFEQDAASVAKRASEAPLAS